MSAQAGDSLPQSCMARCFFHGPPDLAGILVPIGVGARERHVEHVQPAVAVEVADEGQEVVRVAVGIKGLGRIDLVLLLEVGALVPVGPGHHVQLAVIVEVAVVGPFAEELFAEREFLERGKGFFGLANQRQSDDGQPNGENAVHGGYSLGS